MQDPKSRRKKPLGQAILQFLVRAPGRLLVLLFLAWVWFCDSVVWALKFLWRYRVTIRRNTWNGFFRIATLLSVSYLVFDRLYEADATIASPASDPKDTFLFPFSIQNNSHIFSIKNVSWTCQYFNLKGERFDADHIDEEKGSASEIPPGKNLNFICDGYGPNSRMYRMTFAPKLDTATLVISLQYDVDMFGRYSWVKRPPRTVFRWYGKASNPQWIRGDDAQ